MLLWGLMASVLSSLRVAHAAYLNCHGTWMYV
jgi:hypothetical protein